MVLMRLKLQAGLDLQAQILKLERDGLSLLPKAPVHIAERDSTTLFRSESMGWNRLFRIALITAFGFCTPVAAITGQLTAVQCAAAAPWVAWETYSAGQVVTYGGSDYECLQSHRSQPDWIPSAVLALWAPVMCASNDNPCDPKAWVYMGNDANACVGHIGESCGWTATDMGQGNHCQTVSWGTGCEPGGTTCPLPRSVSTPSTSSASAGNSAGLVFSPYKDTTINMDWSTNVIQTRVSGSVQPLPTDLVAHGGKTISLGFAQGECSSENWGGVPGEAMASANVAALNQSGIKYIISTGGAAGIFTCGSDTGMNKFISRWMSPGLIGVDFDIEAGQSQAVIDALIERIRSAHAMYPGLRFSLTLASLANNKGASLAEALGNLAPDSFNIHGDWSLQAIQSTMGFDGSASTWPSYLTVNLMTMDYGSASDGACVVSGGSCQMGQSALQAAYNVHDHWGIPWANIELTPMIGGNDEAGETFTLADADSVAQFALAKGLAGVHYWSYDRDVDCPPGAASPTCNSIGTAGAYGFLKRFLAGGLH